MFHPAWGGLLRHGRGKGGVPMGLTPPRLTAVIRSFEAARVIGGREGSTRPVRAPVWQHCVAYSPPCRRPVLPGRSLRPETVSSIRKLSPAGGLGTVPARSLACLS